MKKYSYFILCFILCLCLCSCSKEKDEIQKDIEIASDEIVNIVKESRSDSENSLYPIKTNTDEITYIDELGIEDFNNIKVSAISLSTENESYCIAIIKAKDLEKVEKDLKEYSEKKKNDLYIENYQESILAEKYKIKKIEDYIIFVMGEDSENICEMIEDALILKINEVRG